MKYLEQLSILLAFLALAIPAMAQQPTDAYLIEFSRGVPNDVEQMVASAGGTLQRVHPEINLAVARSTDPDFAAAVGSIAGVRRVTQDLIVQWIPGGPGNFEASAPSTNTHIIGDPTTAFFYPCQWNLHQIDASGAWAQGEFGAGVKVAVLDTGTDPLHQDLVGKVDLANSVSLLSNPTVCDTFVPDMLVVNDFRFHGAFVSGLIAGEGIGIAGVAPGATIVGVKVLSCLGSGSFADVIAGVLYAAQVPGVEVINMSLGAYFPKNLAGAGPLMGALNQAVNFANLQGVLVVSSAGNNGSDLDHDANFVSVPAQSGAGIAAWAGDIDGNLAGYSNHGLSSVSVGAGGGDNTPGSPNVPLPGCTLPVGGHDGIVSVCSTTSLFFGCGSGASYLFNGSGTSFSAPLVSGVAALVDGKYGGSQNASQLKNALKNTADDLGKVGADNLFSHGRVNACSAVQ